MQRIIFGDLDRSTRNGRGFSYPAWLAILLLQAAEAKAGHKLGPVYKGEHGLMEFEITYNGIEIDYLVFSERIKQAIDGNVEPRAAELLRERLGVEFDDRAQAIQELMRNFERQLSELAGFPAREEW